MKNHDIFYKSALYYDIAFDFKDIPGECDFITQIYQRHNKKKPQSFLECAAGPALHTIEFARRGLRAHAIDLSQHMVRYGRKKAQQQGVKIDYQQFDMTNFALAQPVDTAAILMDSTSYLLTNEAVLRHLDCMAKALTPRGIYLLEMSHPRDVFNVGKSAGTDWERQRDGIKVRTIWGKLDDPFDPTTQITTVSVRLDYEDKGEIGSITDKAPQRSFSANELDALVRACGKFKIVEIFGAMELSVPFNNKPTAWRMIPILQKI